MKQYLDLLREIKEKGTYKAPARENMPGTTSLFGHQMRFDLSDGFPLLTTKKLSFKNIVIELLWFLRGDTNIKYLVDNGCNIWNEDAYNYYKKISDKNDMIELSYEDFILYIKNAPTEEIKNYKHSRLGNYKMGDCGKQYGWLWRSWDGEQKLGKYGYPEEGYSYKQEKIDQLSNLITGLKSNPMGRRHIITAWNPATLDDMALNACHAFVQFNCRPIPEGHRSVNLKKEDLEYDNLPKYYLDCQMYQRSADVFLGVPYNIASYALFTMIMAQVCNMIPGEFIHTFGDVHIYDNHMDQVNEQLTRTPDKLSKLNIIGFPEEYQNPYNEKLFEDLIFQDFHLEGYKPQPAIKAELSTGLIK